MTSTIKFLPIFSILLLVLSCNKDVTTDAALLEKDKKALVESLDSYKVSSYKFGKILIRASVEKDTISPEFKAFRTDLNRIFNTVMKYDLNTPEELSVLDYISIYRDYKKMEDFIMETDEDIFPTLTDAINIHYADSLQTNYTYLTGEDKLYTQNIEHAILSAIVVLSKDLGKEVSLYECSKTKPELLPDSEIKTLLQFFRGFLFFEKQLFYLSENELSRNIIWLENNRDIDLPYTRAMFQWGDLNNQSTHTAFHGLNHLFRGFDRLMMERDIDQKRALEDFEQFLKDAEDIGIENEIIWSVETFLYLKNEENNKAIASLKKLKTSNLLSSKDKKSIDESIVYLKDRKAGEALNSYYDKYFLSKIATKYIFRLLSEIDWKTILEEQNVPHTNEIFKTIEKFKALMDNLETYTNSDVLEDAGENIKNKSKEFWNKTKGILEDDEN
ncbi:short-chain dehydrogenase [uncultured Psychroserpens sp.]|uniref:short-chain dehydrogenase n=1 Tax=uncultured Psychroserpens sp. TaxID=255436 RepID=UPI0026068C67|nr:short-chain dehydrogenase [uncultured Psychroserpens sp.]